MNFVFKAAVIMSLVLTAQPHLYAQTDPAPKRSEPTQQPVRVFLLNNTARQEDASEIVTALRNVLAANNKIFFVQSQNAIAVSGTPEQLELAQRVLTELDRPRKLYRLTFTVTESDAGKRIGVQHFDMVVAGGQRTTMKQGSKVPVVTGNYTAGTSSVQNEFTYIDLGLNVDASLDESANGVRLRCKLERSSVATESNVGTATDPVIRQSVLEGTSFMTPGKPLVLGSLDVPDSTRHLNFEVQLDPAR